MMERSFLRKAARRARSAAVPWPRLKAGSREALSGGPFAAEGSHEDRLDQGDDVLAAGVLRAEGGPLVGVQATGKEGAHDAGLDELPVGFGGFGQGAALVIVQLEDGGVLEEVAVEVANLVLAEHAALGHRPKQGFEGVGELVRVIQGNPGDVGEELLGQQAGVLGEEAEDQAVEEAGNAEVLALGHGDLGAGPGVGQFGAFALLERLGDLGELLRQRLGDLVGGALGLEVVGILEQGVEDAQVLRAVNRVVGELVGFLDRAVEVGADDVAVEIADDEQGRIEQRLAVAEQLLVGFVEALFLALVFPAEAALFPDVGEAALGVVGVGLGAVVLQGEEFGVLDDALLEAEGFEPVGSASAGVGWSSRRQRSVKCSW